jgi:hypothetical protein
LANDLAGFLAAAEELGFTERTRSAAASQVIGRLLIQSGRRLDTLADNDFDDLLAASAARHGRGKPAIMPPPDVPSQSIWGFSHSFCAGGPFFSLILRRNGFSRRRAATCSR